MKTKYYTFEGYCRLYQRLCRELGVVAKKCTSMDSFELLSAINLLLIKNDCQPFTEVELEMKLL